MRHPGLLLALVTVACITTHGSGKTGIKLHPSEEKRLAAGARFDVAIVDTCSNAETELDGKGQGKIPTGITLDVGRQTCEFSSIQSIDKAESSNQAVLTVEKTATSGQYGVLTFLAHEEGEAQISTEITTSTGVYRPGGTYTVQRANEARLKPHCIAGIFTTDHVSVMADLPLTFAYELKRDSWPLKGYGYYPFDTGGLAITDGGVKDFTVVTPAEATSITITSSVDPSLKMTVDVYTSNSIDALNVDVKLGSSASCTATLAVAPSAGTAAWFCNKAPDVKLSIETPESCSFSRTKESLSYTLHSDSGGTDYTGGPVTVYSKANGTCRLRGEAVGGTHTESIEIPFGCTTP